MNVLRASLAVLVLCCAAARADAPSAAPLPQSQDLYSFADLYRVTLGEPVLPPAGAQGATFQVRATSGETPAALAAAAPFIFSIGPVAPVRGGALLFAGLAAALWVARRRLGYSIRA
ncbi:MAG TPA: hypothetical protein VG873_00245 [Burkholderiales bacterium]|nr:hypothetical protein [Burkholderiales bacterium]